MQPHLRPADLRVPPPDPAHQSVPAVVRSDSPPTSMAEPPKHEYEYNEAVEALRDLEYPMLKDSVYLDHAGSTLCSKSLMQAFAADMTSNLYGNPHSASLSSQLSAARIDDTRLRLLTFFNADPTQFELVFVANATAGVKLVLDGLRSLPQGFSFAYHEACHTSLIGAREDAARPSLCLDDAAVQAWLDGGAPPFPSPSPSPSNDNRPETSATCTLFAYSAQSHMDGKRYPLSWSRDVKRLSQEAASCPTLTLLDAASLAATSPLDLSHPDFDADFTVLSLYKIFGFPDLGALIVRRSAQCQSVWNRRRYFGGGTVDMVLCGKEQLHVPKPRLLHERLEDGTLPFHSIMAVDAAMDTHARLFGSMARISSHTSFLCRQMVHSLSQLRHGNGTPVCKLYTALPDHHHLDPRSSLGVGPVVTFNIRDSRGHWIGLAEVEKLAILKDIHIRTGGLCSPARMASTLGLQPWEMRKNLSAGFKCGEDTASSSLKPVGVVRASLGAMSTLSDVRSLVDFVREFFVEQDPNPSDHSPTAAAASHDSPLSCRSLRVRGITVFPIKSCGGLHVPLGVPWEVRPEGLAWDREWCLIHRGSGQVLNQKRYTKMALLQPSLLFERDVLRITYRGVLSLPNSQKAEVDIPLANVASLFAPDSGKCPSKVCGENILAQAYLSEDINAFFSDALGVPCVLARFPAGGCGSSSRACKARVQTHQIPAPAPSAPTPLPLPPPLHALPGSFPDIPSPPDSDSDSSPEQQPPGNILLSNESPILMIHTASVDRINQDIADRGGTPISEHAFRANIIVENPAGQGDSHPPYSEDFWSAVRIGAERFVTLGACQRCQMVCVDQETGERQQEPFSTLAKTRRLHSKVYFGVHMRHDGRGAVRPMIQVGDVVSVERAGEP